MSEPAAAERRGPRSVPSDAGGRRSAPSARAVGGWTITAALVDAVCVMSVLLFYALEVTRPRPHFFGPVSDASGALFDLLLLPLLCFAVQRLEPRTPARGYALVVLVATAIGALNSALLVLRLNNDAVSFVLTVVIIAIQGGWFLLMGRRGPAAIGLSRALARRARLVGLGILVSIVVLIPAALLPASSPVAVVLWILGGAVGGIAWISWPAWLTIVGRYLRRWEASAGR